MRKDHKAMPINPWWARYALPTLHERHRLGISRLKGRPTNGKGEGWAKTVSQAVPHNPQNRY